MWHAGLLHKLQYYEILVRYLALFLLFSVIDGLRLNSWSYINDLPDDVICNIVVYAEGATLYSKYDQASDLW